jgi:circadian clock protein KaiC
MAPPPSRFPTGVDGLDSILRGGLFKGGIYMAVGAPGAGKTVLANQIAYGHVSRGGRAVYVTLLAETHGRLLGQIQTLSYFDATAVGTSLVYVNGFEAVEKEGLQGLLALLQGTVRQQRADFLVIDGMVAASTLAPSPIDYKKFIKELQTWVGVVGCTVLLLTSTEPGSPPPPEHTMVDGIFELCGTRIQLRDARLFSVRKIRGSGFADGAHEYNITEDGVRIYQRLETQKSRPLDESALQGRASFGDARLDEMFGGGAPRGSSTLLLGSSGSGKTILALQFLAAGAQHDERALYYGFFEPPENLLRKADRLGLALRALQQAGGLHLMRQRPRDKLLDQVGAEILEIVERERIRRLVVDGLAGLRETVMTERLGVFFAALTEQLACLGVTTVVTEETRELFVREIEIPTGGVSAAFHNIVFLRQVEIGSELRRLISVMKTRDSRHASEFREFAISDLGISVGDSFNGHATIFTGTDQRRGGFRRLAKWTWR